MHYKIPTRFLDIYCFKMFDILFRKTDPPFFFKLPQGGFYHGFSRINAPAGNIPKAAFRIPRLAPHEKYLPGILLHKKQTNF